MTTFSHEISIYECEYIFKRFGTAAVRMRSPCRSLVFEGVVFRLIFFRYCQIPDRTLKPMARIKDFVREKENISLIL